MRLYVMSGNREVAVYEDGILNITDESLAPIYLKRTRDFVTWVSDRAIDPDRPNSRVLKKLHGLSRLSSDYETAMLYNAASVTDNFWVRKSDETWEEVKFNNDLYFRAAVTSDNSAYELRPSRTPELTNVGSREKGWRLLDGTWWLYKNEPELNQTFEVLTSEIGMLLGMDMAYYELDGDLIRSRDITEGRYNLQHIDCLMYDHDGIIDDDLMYNYEVLHEISPDIARQYLDIKYLDSLVNNVDRHTKNYALLTSQEDGSIVGLAPNYDNDMALYGYPSMLEGKRRVGEISEFLKIADKISYEPPVLEEAGLRSILSKYDNIDNQGIYRYLLDGQELIINTLAK